MAVQTDCKSVTKEIKALQLHHKPSAVGMVKEPLGMDDITLNIAITGETGSGKSTFVNAFRGVIDDDEGAAPTGVTECTMEVKEYFHPNYPNVKFWDLPGVGTPNFPADTYLERVGFEKFDFFIIITAVRFKENDVKLAQEIQRMKKKFYFVRSKIDDDIDAEKRKSDFSEEEALTKIRDDCVQGVRGLGIESPQVFLVSSFELHLYDFSLLQETLERELPELKRDALLFATPSVNLEIISKKKEAFKTLSTSTDDQFGFALVKEEINEALLKNDTAAAAAKITELMMKEKNIRLNIAITGESGSGKSTFVNALRGLCDDDEGAAPTGVTETTSEVTPYPHPNYPNVMLWDLPGIGTTKFPADKYLELVGFDKFDFFIIISADRFRENDVKLAQEIQKMKKKFYFVRSKIDNNIRAERRKRDFSAERTLTEIRDDCVKGLQRQGVESPQVFLVSSFELHLYDFSLLHQTLDRDLPAHKRDALLRAMPNFNPEIIRKKKQALKSRIKYYALGSASGAAVPVPGLSILVDAALLVGAVTEYVHAFGLDIPSLKRLSARTGVSYADLRAVIISPLAAAEIRIQLFLKVIVQLGSVAALIVAEEVSRFIPFIGIPAAAGLSFTTTYRILKLILDKLAEDALRVFERALV
ncbi:interferon-inducible GTPase 5-like [Pelmatolapia mariae]|uniref:interferon-inducible GTPase 5-like n=1 Tax=Pelmatolapia mariae TaxID=158779 RepID=UPI002FE6310B